MLGERNQDRSYCLLRGDGTVPLTVDLIPAPSRFCRSGLNLRLWVVEQVRRLETGLGSTGHAGRGFRRAASSLPAHLLLIVGKIDSLGVRGRLADGDSGWRVVEVWRGKAVETWADCRTSYRQVPTGDIAPIGFDSQWQE